MIRPIGAAVAALLFLGVPAAARAQAASDSAAAGADTSSLAQAMALEDSTRALLAQDDSQTQVDQARLDSLQTTLQHDRQLRSQPAAAVSHDRTAVNETKHAVHQDVTRTKHTRSQLTSLEKQIKKAQAPARKASATVRPPHPAPASR